MKSKCFVLLITAGLLATLAGCSPNVGLKGKVTFSDDGSPLTAGTVVFKKGNLISRGQIKPDGTFIVGSMKESDGLAPGSYMVYITGAVRETIPADDQYEALIEPLIAPKFTKSESSGIAIEITRTTRTFEFQVDRYVPTSTKPPVRLRRMLVQ